ncbi:MAG: EF-P lysine aminoacylase GenX [Parachlamydiaceae bacterium]|nr:EF-P lysine aminoacylase GenX [Parachlamydiaceae bacterium]
MIENSRLKILRDRSKMLAAARQFFYSRNMLEVDCPLITSAASIDAHIDLIPTEHKTGKRYLHSSPEYGMKRLLTEGIGDIFQLAHVFRQEETGTKHNPEFMMAEWYRLGFTFEEMMNETLDFVRVFLGPIQGCILSYHDAFQNYVGIDPYKSSCQDLLKILNDHQLPLYSGVEEESKDNLLNLILGMLIEPHLGKDNLIALAYYPASQAALAKTRLRPEGDVAERFEVYFQGIELANGYHELADPKEQRIRFNEANLERKNLGKETLPLDERFLGALEKGLPDCCGVAVGVDRLMMLRHQVKNISEIITFGWDQA